MPDIGWVAALPLPDGTLFGRPGRSDWYSYYTSAWSQASGQLVLVVRWPDGSLALLDAGEPPTGSGCA